MKIKLTLVTSLIVGFTLSIRCASSNMDLPQVEDITASTGFYVTGPVTSWQTANGIYTAEHLAGQTPQGDLLIFWRQPDGVGWRVVNVTEITGKRIFSPLTSWQTPNGPYNVELLAGRSPDNDLLVFFWQPDGRDWRVVNVSEITGKQISGSVTSWQTPNGPYNVEDLAGRSPDNDLLVFYWQPDGRDWRVVNVTQQTGEKISGEVVSWQTPNGPYNVEHLAGRSPDNDLLVFYWQPDGRDWRVVNVSNLAGKKIVDAPRAYQILNNKENVEMIAARGVESELLQFWLKPSRDWQVLDLTEWAGRTIASIPEPWVLSSNSNDLPLEYLAATNCNNHLLLFRDYAEERDVVDKMGEPVHGLKRLRGQDRNLLTILWDPHRIDHPAASRQEVETLLFGDGNSVKSYFLENSGGKFTMKNAGIMGWYDADYSWDLYSREGPYSPELWKGTDRYYLEKVVENGESRYKARYIDNEGFIHGHAHKWTEAIRKAAIDFEFEKYDFNHDGTVSTDELSILIIIPQTDPFGTNQPVFGRQWPANEPLFVDGVQINTIAEAYIASAPSSHAMPIAHLGTAAHELSHILLGLGDMYFWFFQPYAAGGYSLMDRHFDAPHLDPFAKLKLGWVQPRLVLRSGQYRLNNVETSGHVWVLANPERGLSEYFILENRWGENTFDQRLLDQGLAIWHIIETKEVYGNLPAPPNSDVNQWNEKVLSWEWARRGIRMIRENGIAPPFVDDKKALWDDQSAPGMLFWADGSPSGFSVDYVSKAGAEIMVNITSALDQRFSEPVPLECENR